MNVALKYTETRDLPITSLAVIGDFNHYDPKKGQMEKLGEVWTFTTHLPPGEYTYRFLVNGVLELNDPEANAYYPDAQDKLWSRLVIDAAEERLYNNTPATVHIQQYTIHSRIHEQAPRPKKVFTRTLDSKVVARFDFTQITGIHTVTTAWYNPYGELFQVVENNLYRVDGADEKESQPLWFWLDLTESGRHYPTGSWMFQLFINGQFILADHFHLRETSVYSSQGRVE